MTDDPTPSPSIEELRAEIDALWQKINADGDTQFGPSTVDCRKLYMIAKSLLADQARLVEALEQIELMSTNHGGWFEQDPFGSYARLGDIARAALTPDKPEMSTPTPEGERP